MSAKYNLVCEQATTFNFQFQVLNNTASGSTPWNLTSYTGTMTVRPFVTTVLVSTANGGRTFDQSNGRITVLISADVTADIAAGRYVYDLVLDSGGTVTRLLEGKFVVTGAVTT